MEKCFSLLSSHILQIYASDDDAGDKKLFFTPKMFSHWLIFFDDFDFVAIH